MLDENREFGLTPMSDPRGGPVLGPWIFQSDSDHNILDQLLRSGLVLVNPDAAHVLEARRRGYQQFRIFGLHGEDWRSDSFGYMMWVNPFALISRISYAPAPDQSGRWIGYWTRVTEDKRHFHFEVCSGCGCETSVRDHILATDFQTQIGGCVDKEARALLAVTALMTAAAAAH